jgi:hypothetical protein
VCGRKGAQQGVTTGAKLKVWGELRRPLWRVGGEGGVDLQKISRSRYRAKSCGTMGSEMERYGAENFCKFFGVDRCHEMNLQKDAEDTLKRGHQAGEGVGQAGGGTGSGRCWPGADWVCFSSGVVMAQLSVFGSCAEKASSTGRDGSASPRDEHPKGWTPSRSEPQAMFEAVACWSRFIMFLFLNLRRTRRNRLVRLSGMKGGSGRSLDRRSSIQPRVPFSGTDDGKEMVAVLQERGCLLL